MAAEIAPVDRRITRSKRALRKALIELTEECGLDGFTVNDLCARADLNRGTFYNHFHDKDDLLAVLENEVMDDLRRFNEEINKLTLLDLAKIKLAKRAASASGGLVRLSARAGDFLCAMLGPGRCQARAAFARLALHRSHPRSAPRAVPQRPDSVRSILRLLLRFGLPRRHHALARGGMKESSEEMARIAIRLLFIKPGESDQAVGTSSCSRRKPIMPQSPRGSARAPMRENTFRGYDGRHRRRVLYARDARGGGRAAAEELKAREAVLAEAGGLLRLGIDVGSTTVKLAVLDATGEVKWAVYCRHHADVRATIVEVLKEAAGKFPVSR